MKTSFKKAMKRFFKKSTWNFVHKEYLSGGLSGGGEGVVRAIYVLIQELLLEFFFMILIA